MNVLSSAVYYLINRIHGERESQELLAKQEELFTSLKLDRSRGLSKINDVCTRLFGVEYSEHNGMWSEHLVFLASLSESQESVKNILEIGTFKGQTTLIISQLFPDSKIISVDLNHDEIKKNRTYSYALPELGKKKNFEKIPNVEFLELNSLQLLSFNVMFDLIWVDGYHLSPTVIVDISNSVRMLRSGGIALCDDVILRKSNIDRDTDLSSWLTLKELAACGLIQLTLINKRIAKKFNNTIVQSKFLGVAIRN